MNIIKQTEDFVYTLLKDKLSNSFLYHNFNHTSTVVKAVEEIVRFSNVDENEREKLLIAAWFHDVGYIEGAQNHEDRSAKIAGDFLLEKGFDAAYIESVAQLIKATKMEFIPTTTSEQIIKDADYYHLLIVRPSTQYYRIGVSSQSSHTYLNLANIMTTEM